MQARPRPPLHVVELGRVAYADALAIQEDLVRRRRSGTIPDRLLLLEHPHVITLGSSARREHILVDDAGRRRLGIEIHPAGRGGDVTYHGPGQLVGYPILDLKPDRCDLHRYVRDLEEALIATLGELGVRAERRHGYTGVWVEGEKVAAIGVRVSSGWITSHGFALNVSTDLSYFDTIIPCGVRDYGVTSLSRVLGEAPPPAHVHRSLARSFARVFDRRLKPFSRPVRVPEPAGIPPRRERRTHGSPGTDRPPGAARATP